ncbi:hypothetical protein Hanom_Chr07g00613841 [Helianthus anomalus]
MRVVHFELSCVAVSGELSVPLFCMFYKLISDGDWFNFAKRKDSMSLWGLLQGDCRYIKFMVGDKVEPNMSRGVEKKVHGMGSSVMAEDSAVEGKKRGRFF